MSKITFYTGQTQQGVALIIVLILLMVVAIIGTSSMQSTTFQERMTGNQKEQSLAFNMAEAALRAAETYLEGSNVGAFDGNTDGQYYSTASDVPDWADSDSSDWVSRTGTVTDVAKQPEYIIEELPTVYDPTSGASADTPLEEAPMYRVTARGYGITDSGSTVLQTIYKR